MIAPRVRSFDISTVRASADESAYQRGRECLRAGPVQSLSWEWMGGALFANGVVRDPAGVRFSPSVNWNGQALRGSCTCTAPEGDRCAHQVALALHLVRINPWRTTPPVGWQTALDLALPARTPISGEQRFIFRVEVRTRTGDPIGRLRVRLSRARVGKRGLGRETPYPASRLKSLTLDSLPSEERAFIAWLLPLQSWSSSQNFGYATDPRYLDVPPPLVGAALHALAGFQLCYYGEEGETQFRIAPAPLHFGLETAGEASGSLRLTGRLTETSSSVTPAGAEEVLPEAMVGERPSFALLEGVFYPIVHLERPELWSLTRFGDVVVPQRDVRTFLEAYVPSLQRGGLITPDELIAAIPESIAGLTPTPLLSLEEEMGVLVARLVYRYGPEFMLPAGSAREVEELEVRGRRLLIHRSREQESDFENRLREGGMIGAGPGRFEATGETALEFLLEHLPNLLTEGWVIEGEERLQRYKPSRTPIRVRGAITTGMNWFELSLTAMHGEQELPLSDIFLAWRAGRRFVRFGDGQQALLPEAWLKRNRGLLSAILGDAADLTDQDDEETTQRAPRLDEAFRAPIYLAPLIEGAVGDDAEITTDEGWKRFLDALRTFGGVTRVPLPVGLQAELREYQHSGVDWACFLRDTGMGGILADDMGLGKTVQALTLLLIEKQRQPGYRRSLVVAPTSVIFNWELEARRFAPDLKVLVMHGPDRHERLAALPDVDLLVTSYALLRRDLAMHLETEYHYVILDEAQTVKNPDSQTALAARSLKAAHRLSLTGTPIENRLAELWSQFAFLMPGLFPSLRRFMSDYVLPIERNQDPERRDELRRRIYPFVLRRLKEEVASELPPRTDSVLYCELEGPQRRLYQAVLKASRERVRRALEEKGGRAQITALDALLKLRQICCHPGLVHLPEAMGVDASAKLDLFRETLTEILSEGHRVLVFSQFVEMLSVLRTELDKAEVPYEYLDGRTRDRQERVDRFNAGSTPVFLISLKAGGTGLNLASADYVIHYDPWWNPAVEDQATDRAYRIGQTRPVFSYKLIARDTVEEKILVLQQRKRDLAEGLLDSEGNFEKVLTPDDFEFLFEETGDIG